MAGFGFGVSGGVLADYGARGGGVVHFFGGDHRVARGGQLRLRHFDGVSNDGGNDGNVDARRDVNRDFGVLGPLRPGWWFGLKNDVGGELIVRFLDGPHPKAGGGQRGVGVGRFLPDHVGHIDCRLAVVEHPELTGEQKQQQAEYGEQDRQHREIEPIAFAFAIEAGEVGGDSLVIVGQGHSPFSRTVDRGGDHGEIGGVGRPRCR